LNPGATALLLLLSASLPVHAQEPQQFARCAACHGQNSNSPTVGPDLKGVFGRKAASRDDFRYSPAMARSGLVWTEKNLDAFLKAPDQFLPGTRMPFEGMPSAAERAAVIRYLKSLKQ
jgi:cytochrome c